MRSNSEGSQTARPGTFRRFRVAAAIWLIAFAGAALAAENFPPLGIAGESHPGKFVWFDLVTADLPAARRFYGDVFGWKFRAIGSAPASYTIVENAGRNIAGMFVHAPPPGAPASARWLSLISVRDPAQAVRYVEQNGGTVIVPLATIPGRGTHVLFRDPEGAVFGVLKSETGDPPDTPVDDGDFFWLDLLARNPEQAAKFYGGLAGYEANVREVGKGVMRVVLASGGYSRAGIAPLPAQVKTPGWLPYVLVDDVGATIKKALAAGGKVLVDPRPELLDGNLAVIADPNGGVLGLVNWTAPPQSEPKQ